MTKAKVANNIKLVNLLCNQSSKNLTKKHDLNNEESQKLFKFLFSDINTQKIGKYPLLYFR